MSDDVQRLAAAIRRRTAGTQQRLVPPPPSLPPTSTSGALTQSAAPSATSTRTSSSSSSSTSSRADKQEVRSQDAPSSSQSSSSLSAASSPSPISEEILSLISAAVHAELSSSSSSRPAHGSSADATAASSAPSSSSPEAPPSAASSSMMPSGDDLAAALAVLKSSNLSHLLQSEAPSPSSLVPAGAVPSHSPRESTSVAVPSIAVDSSDSDSDSAPTVRHSSSSSKPQDVNARRRYVLKRLIRDMRKRGVFSPSGSPSTDLQKLTAGHFIGLKAAKTCLFTGPGARAGATKIYTFGDLARVHLKAVHLRASDLLATDGAKAAAAYMFESVSFAERILSLEPRFSVEHAVQVHDAMSLQSAQDGKPVGSAALSEALMSSQFESPTPPATASPAAASSSPKNAPRPLCGRFNSFAGCNDSFCSKAHRCRSCNSNAHGKPDCPRHPNLRSIMAGRGSNPAFGMPFFYPSPSHPSPGMHSQQPPLPHAHHQPQQAQFPGAPTGIPAAPFSYLPPLPGAVTAYAAPMPPVSTPSGHPPAPKRPKRL